MSDNTQGPQACPVGEMAVLWSDNDIIAAYHKAFERYPDVHTYALMCRIRDDYERICASLAARMYKLESQLDNARKWLPDSALEDNDE